MIHDMGVFFIIIRCFVNIILMLDTWIASTLPLDLYCHLLLGLYIFLFIVGCCCNSFGLVLFLYWICLDTLQLRSALHIYLIA